MIGLVADPSLSKSGSYQLMSLIRAGHTCEIWDVQSLADRSRFGMKLLPSGSRHTREQVNLLKHEFAVGQGFDHECVIKTYDFGSARFGTFIIMELFKYPNLKQRLNQGADAIAYLAETVIENAASGLAYMHGQGWIHRDVKPDNFLIDDEGGVRLIDFNLARRVKKGLAKIISGKEKVQGTKSYMSPEQIRGQTPDERSDIYSFGCVLYEMISGRAPFTGVSANDLLTKHLRNKPSPLEVYNDNVNSPFARLIDKMLAKRPGDRPASIDDFLVEMKSSPIFRRRPEAPT